MSDPVRSAARLLTEESLKAARNGTASTIVGGEFPHGSVSQCARDKSLVSVVINTFNRAKFLENAIGSIAYQTYADVELIVVDGPSTDGTQELLDALEARGLTFKRARCNNRNLSESRNIGIAQAAGDVVCFIDDDAVAHPSWVERLMTAYADPAVGAAGGFTVDHTGVTFQCRYTVCDRFGNAQFFNTIDPTPVLDGLTGFRFPSLLGTNCSFRRRNLLDIGGFDEVYAYFLDETDVCLRLFERGLRVVTVPTALVFHKYAPSDHRTAERIPGSLVAPARSKAHFVVKHAGGGLPSAESQGELERYSREVQFSNRWFLDHKQISPAHYLRLDSELKRGLAAGIRGAVGTQDSGSLAAHSDGEDRPLPFLNIVSEHRSRAVRARMRIYFVSQGYPPRDTSGIARWTHECALSLRDRGHEIHVITRSGTRADFVDYVDGVWVHSVVDKSPADVILPSPVDIPDCLARRAAAVFSELQRSEAIWGVDVVSAPIWDVEGIYCAKYLRKPVVTSLHTTYLLALPSKPDWTERPGYRRAHVDKVITAEHWLLKNSGSILGNSGEIVREIDRAYGISLSTRSKVLEIVPHGIRDIERSEAVVRQSGQREEVSLLFVGRIEARKGLDQLLESLILIRPLGATIKLHIVGAWSSETDSYAQRVRALAREVAKKRRDVSVIFLGYATDEQLKDFYASADIFVAPSRFESFGLIVIEAMRSGLPVIAADIGGMREIVDPETGLLFPLGDCPALAARLEALIADRALRERMGAAGKSKFQREYTASIMAGRLETYFRGVAERGVGT